MNTLPIKIGRYIICIHINSALHCFLTMVLNAPIAADVEFVKPEMGLPAVSLALIFASLLV